MAKHNLRLKARKLREEGASVKEISRTLGVAKSTASIWVRDIILTIEQLEILRNNAIIGAERGRLKSAFLQKEKRLKVISQFQELGIKKLENLTQREFLVAGLSLYWGGGSKKSQQVQFCNSDPRMIKFMIKWLKAFFNVDNEEMRCRLGINETHRSREIKVKEYWVEVTGIPISQFNKTLFKKTVNKKVYSNFQDHYGTLAVSVLKPTRYFYDIIGMIDGLNKAGELGWFVASHS